MNWIILKKNGTNVIRKKKEELKEIKKKTDRIWMTWNIKDVGKLPEEKKEVTQVKEET